jgi:hypothetical protein
MDDPQERIISFTAKELGMKAERVRLDSRLSHDLGMDGDDAVEFFQAFGKDFNVDLEALWHHWDRHFRPEGGGPPLGFVIVIGASVFVGDLLHQAVRRIPVWGWMIVLILAFGWAYSRFFTERRGLNPITVQDLVDAARTGKWVKEFDESGVEFRMGA